ncbi:MAG: peptidylprolyl isomerase [Pseudomonadales bacterium]
MSDTAAAERDRVVRFHYRLSNEAGEPVEDSRDDEPALALLGHGNLMRGLEEAMLGHHAGERFSVSLTPEQAFGPLREGWSQRVSKKHFPKGARFQPGARLRLNTDQGARTVTVTKVGNKFVDVDLNHPLAGQAVTFEVELLEVRDATAEERAHGHAHGAGGHHH